jgi:uncharacterized protein YfiM (DUF2279 family)
MIPLTLALTLTLAAPPLTQPDLQIPALQSTRDGVYCFPLTIADLHSRSTAPRDEWFAEDKLKHMFLSMAVVGFAQAGARTAGAARTPAVAIGVSLGAAAGLWKEWHDRRTGRPFSARDLAWDALGIAAGALLVSQARE